MSTTTTPTFHFPRLSIARRSAVGIVALAAATSVGVGVYHLARDDGDPSTVRAVGAAVPAGPSAADYGLGVALSTDAGLRAIQHPDAVLGDVLFGAGSPLVLWGRQGNDPALSAVFGTDIPQPTASVSDNGLSLIFSPTWPVPAE